MGHFVDRGFNSVETFELLLLLKVRYPQCITLIRGNHESRQITQVYGFYDECLRKYGNANPWKYCTEIFDFLTLSAIVENSIFCVHGGLSPDVKLLDQVRTIQRVQEIPHEGAFGDLVWSAPNYCYRCGNVAAILSIDEQESREFRIFKEVPMSAQSTPPRQLVPYFL